MEKVVAAPYTPDVASGPDEQRRVGGASGAAPFKEVANPYLKDTRASGSNPSRLDPSPGSRALDCDESMVWCHATSLRNYTFLSSTTPSDGGLAVVLQNQIRSALRCTNIVSREYLLKPWPAQNDRPDFGRPIFDGSAYWMYLNAMPFIATQKGTHICNHAPSPPSSKRLRTTWQTVVVKV